MLSNINEETQQKILDLLKETQGNYTKVAAKTKLTTYQIKLVDMIRNRKHNYTPQGRGRPELEKYTVAIKAIDALWDNQSEAIIEARDNHEAGLTTMVTGRDGFKNILYSIPLKKPAKPNNYFTLIEEGVEPDE